MMDRAALLNLLFEKDSFLLHLDTGLRVKEPQPTPQPRQVDGASYSQNSKSVQAEQLQPSQREPVGHAERTSAAPTNETVCEDIEGNATPIPVVSVQEDGNFCPLMAVSRFPYRHIKGELSQTVARNFFDGGKFWERVWDIYYIQPPARVAPRALLLVPAAQVRVFFKEINTTLRCNLTIPAEKQGMQLTFNNPNFPSPKFLGQCTSRQTKDQLESQIPLRSTHLFAPSGMDEEYLAYEKMLDSACSATKNKKTSKAKQQSRLQNQIRTVECLTRLQSYFGLRSQTAETLAVDGDLTWEGQTYQQMAAENGKVIESAQTQLPLDVTKPVPYSFWKEPIFVCVDVEANERRHSEVTEVGISMLDTKDLVGVAPGEQASQWRMHIRSRHLRVSEHRHVVNRIYLAGCPERFDFGKSEFVYERDLGAAVLAAFQPPPVLEAGSSVETDEPRHLVLVGHNIAMDMQYLREMGVHIDQKAAGTAGFIDVVDTADVFRLLRREESHRSLAKVLHELEMTGWNLHNAGNDARYTLEKSIIGGGPCGLTFARFLELASLDYVVFERDPSPEYTPRFQGGTLDLTAEGGQAALRRAGLTTEFEKLARRNATILTIQDAHGNNRITVGGADNDRPEIDRRQLRRLLLDSVPPHRIRWGKALQRAELEPSRKDTATAQDWVLQFADGTSESGFRLIVGADGAWSKLRPLITLATPQYSGKTFIEGRLSPGNPAYAAALDMVGAGNSLAIGAGRCLCIQQMSDRSYRVYMGVEAAENLTRAGGDADVADMAKARATVESIFADWAPHLRAFVAAAEEPWRPWSLYRLDADVFLPGAQWTRARGVVLLGDAAHVTTPNGEGVNHAMLDAMVLAERICAELEGAAGFEYDREKDAAALERAIVAYEANMRPRARETLMDSLTMEEMMYAEDGAMQMIRMFESFKEPA
ncbi:hypothetical protein BJX96DRAFT_182140 [Aspergillus floccosus]